MKRQTESTIDEEMGERLRAWRKQCGANQTRAAEIGGVSLNSQHRYESGSLPPIEYLLRIGEAGADWYWIVTGKRVLGTALDDDAAAMLEAFVTLPSEARELLLQHARNLCRILAAKDGA